MYDKKQIPMLNRLPITRMKLFIARMLYRMLSILLSQDQRYIRRDGINYKVDLAEGIDFSIFLFGNFQRYITQNRYFSLPDDAIIYDIGANIGSMTLKFAQLAQKGSVYAFEPTNYAFNKLLTNVELNPELSHRIVPIQRFVSNHSEIKHKIKAHSSWRIDGKYVDANPLHGGIIKSAESVPVITIDYFCREREITRVNLIKIDTDGHEYSILRGAQKSLGRFLPYIIFEIGIYVMEERGISFEQYYDYLSSFDYTLINAKNGRNVTINNFQNEIPLRSTTDIIAIPQTLGTDKNDEN
jgi:FkbM family methyltransferase